MSASSFIESSGFDHFGLNKALIRGIRAAGFEAPRPIQSETIPAGLDGIDVLGLAQTGTGKTAAFALPLLDRILEVNGVPASRIGITDPGHRFAFATPAFHLEYGAGVPVLALWRS